MTESKLPIQIITGKLQVKLQQSDLENIIKWYLETIHLIKAEDITLERNLSTGYIVGTVTIPLEFEGKDLTKQIILPNRTSDIDID